jgi:hypothetical protein
MAEAQYMTLSDDNTNNQSLNPPSSQTTAIALGSNSYGGSLESLKHEKGLTRPEREAALLRDGTNAISQALLSGSAKSMISIGVGVAAGVYVGWKQIYPRARRGYGKGFKTMALSVAGGLVSGIIAHGAASYVHYKVTNKA